MSGRGATESGGVVAVTGGAVAGERVDDLWGFLGIPFARAPVGPLRWRPPVEPEPWSGVRSARAPGPIAPQPPPVPGATIPGDPTEQSEDCLSLNVWTPGLDEGARPVMVWIHGGGFTGGSGSSVLYDGSALARLGDVVVVTVNYRLGALGYLAHPALEAGDGGTLGNYGLLDQIAALRWVQRHIAGFGGDPSTVTVFGESAGGMSVSALLAAPSARGLFRRAVVQSGPPYVHLPQRGRLAAEHLAEELGITEVTRERLAGVPAEALVQATGILQQRGALPGEIPLPFLPVVDGSVVPVPPLDAVSAGAAAGIDLLIGTNRDELAFFGLADPRLLAMEGEELRDWFGHSAPWCDPERVVQTYEAALTERGEPAEGRHIWIAAGSDLVFRRPSWILADTQASQHRGVWVYLFTYGTPAFGGFLGSCHALEVPFVFGTHRRRGVTPFVGQGPTVDELSLQMQLAWLSFARTGDPAHDGIGPWNRWDPVTRPVMVFGPGAELGERPAPRSEELVAWEPGPDQLSASAAGA